MYRLKEIFTGDVPKIISFSHTLQVLGTSCKIIPVTNTTTWSVLPTFMLLLLVTAAECFRMFMKKGAFTNGNHRFNSFSSFKLLICTLVRQALRVSKVSNC